MVTKKRVGKTIPPELKVFTEKFQEFFSKNIASGTYIIHEYLKEDYDFLLYVISSKPGRWSNPMTENVRYTLFKNLPSRPKDVHIPKYLLRKILSPAIPFSLTSEGIVRMFQKSEGLKAFCKKWFEENYYKKT